MTSRFGTGRARTTLVVIVAVLSLVAATLFVSVQSRRSSAMTMTPDKCTLAQLAFCDTFQTIVGGGREGDLDPAKWSFTRDSQQNNPDQGQFDNYAPSLAEFCMTKKVVQPDKDSFICGEQFGESNHWMESMDDNGQYVMNSARIRQPFDFANRTGNIVFDVDAKTEGPHSFWTEVWVTDQPIQGPHTDHPGTHSYPRNGVGFVFDADWCGGALQSANGLREIDTFTNYQETVHNVRSPCFKVQSDNANRFQIQISKTHINVYASDAGGVNFRRISSTDVSLNFTRGYVHFQHSQYDAEKFNSTDTMTYHWHAIGFDGPVIAPDRSYEVPDALAARPDGTVNLGYQVPTKTFTVPNVNLTHVAQAYLTYSTWFSGAPKTMTASINGRTSAPYSDPTDGIGTNGANGYTWRYMVQPVSLSALHQGTNTVSLNTSCDTDPCPTVANIDLEFVMDSSAPKPPPPTMPMPRPPAAAHGYWVADRSGRVWGFGLKTYGTASAAMTGFSPVVAMGAMPGLKGYWLASADGGVYPFGSARSYGSLKGRHLNQPIVAMAPTRSGRGYWLLARDGGIFSFGDARFFGSTGALRLNSPIVDLSPTPTGRGYRLVAADGGIFDFGDAHFYGSTAALHLSAPVVSMAASATGRGYWLIAADGGVFCFGDAKYHGSLPSRGIAKFVARVRANASGGGYWILSTDGGVYAFGNAVGRGSVPGVSAVDIAAG